MDLGKLTVLLAILISLSSCRQVEAQEQTKSKLKMLVSNLGDEDDAVKSKTFNRLRKICDKQPELLIHLIDAIVSDDSYTSARILQIFREMGSRANPCVKTLIKRLNSTTNEYHITNWLEALGYIGPKASGAVNLVNGYINHRDKYVVFEAINTLMKISSNRTSLKPAARKLTQIIMFGLGQDRLRASLLAPGVGALVCSELIPYLKKNRSQVERRLALQGLANIGRSASAALPQVIEIAKNGNKTERLFAISALGGISCDNAEATAFLFKLITTDKDPLLKEKALLSFIFSDSVKPKHYKLTITLLRKVLSDIESVPIIQVLLAIKHLGKIAKPLIPDLRAVKKRHPGIIDSFVKEAIQSAQGASSK